ncbi:Ig-like domain-containing protein [Secundilactobacillus oryzae]|uniref:Ig-like domain-containing protein n=1 Tax=Secundilactobacillus oryzae TaxID=1202668 RepID=UPI0006D09874|nr:Ig-like domain-containing protein [Secundilactobacillus oryzae]
MQLSFFAVAAIIGISATVNASAASTPSLSVNATYAGAKTVTGKATKGVTITVRNAKKQTLARSTASKTTGKYTVKLNKALTKNAKIYVYARANGAANYFYRIITVQAASAKSATTTAKTSSTTTKTTTSSTKSVTPDTPNGTWKSNKVNGYQLKYVFSQKTGFNAYVLKSGKTTAVTTGATYKVTQTATNLWKITTKTHNGDKGTFYMSFKSNKKFTLVNSKNQAVKTSIGNAPKAVYTFTR